MPKSNVIKKSALAPTCLIAGGAGFIGSNLAETLLEKGSRVIVIDNFSTGKKSYVDHLLTNNKFALYDADINFGIPKEIISVDYIFHLAGLEEYLYSKENIDLDSLLTNALGTKNLLDLAQVSQAKFMLVSTIDVYQGMMSQIALDEYFGRADFEEKKYSTTEAKRYAEALVWEYHKKHNTDVRIARLPEVFGPKMNLDASGSLGRNIRNLVEGKNLTVFGDGNSKEYYLYISDAVSALIKILFSDGTKGNIYSPVKKEPFTELETAFLLKSLANRSLDVEFKPESTFVLPKPPVPDTFNLNDIDWKPRVGFKEGIINTLSSFGYDVNKNSFKPAQLIQNKLMSKTAVSSLISSSTPVSTKEEVLTLQDIKPVSKVFADKPTKSILDQLNEWASPKKRYVKSEANSPKKVLPKIGASSLPAFKFVVPKVELPQVQLPKISLPKVTKPTVSFNFSFLNILAGVFATLLAALIVFVGIPLVGVYFNAKSGKAFLEKVPQSIVALNANEAVKNSQKAYQRFLGAQTSFSRLSWLFKLGSKEEEYKSIARLFSAVSHVSKAAENISTGVEPLSKLWDAINPSSSTTMAPSDFETSKLAVANSQNFIQLAQADFNFVNIDLLPSCLKSGARTLGDYLQSSSKNLNDVNVFTSGLSTFLGVDAPKKYLILFQNSNEMRPTGGFVGSYGVLGLDKGKIVDLAIDDIYNPDGQIDTRNIRVVPPKPIADFLAEDRLYLRNANWNPDFTASANDILNLYYRVTGQKIDGVIAIDLYFVQALLKVTGPVYLAAYEEEISAENLYERTQFHSDFNYEEGVSEKKAFLTILGSKLLERFFTLSKSQMSSLFTEVQKSFVQRHSMVYLVNNPLSSILRENRWDGSLVESSGDYLYVVNANLGGTKANYYVENSYTYNVSSKTRDGVLRSQLVLHYKHTGENDSWPSGPYTNYLRVLTPLGSKLTGAKIKYINVSEEENILSSVLTSSIGSHTSFETSFILQPKGEIEVTMEYDLPTALDLTKDSKSYKLYWQKQPGTQKDKYIVDISLPFGATTNDPTKYEGVLDTDKEIYVEMR